MHLAAPLQCGSVVELRPGNRKVSGLIPGSMPAWGRHAWCAGAGGSRFSPWMWVPVVETNEKGLLSLREKGAGGGPCCGAAGGDGLKGRRRRQEAREEAFRRRRRWCLSREDPVLGPLPVAAGSQAGGEGWRAESLPKDPQLPEPGKSASDSQANVLPVSVLWSFECRGDRSNRRCPPAGVAQWWSFHL